MIETEEENCKEIAESKEFKRIWRIDISILYPINLYKSLLEIISTLKNGIKQKIKN